MIRVVIDTSVMVSGLYLPASKPGEVVALARKGVIVNLVSQDILAEIERVLVRKFSWEGLQAGLAVRQIRAFSEPVKTTERLIVISHEADNRILECGVAGSADFIISGDRHLLELGAYQQVKMVKAAEFLAFLSV